jgi:hypothetical protein
MFLSIWVWYMNADLYDSIWTIMFESGGGHGKTGVYLMNII